MANKKPIIKADANGLTPEQKAEQVARFFTQKRQELFNGLLFNLAHAAGPDTDIKAVVDKAITGADYAIERLFPLPTEKEDAKC
jgi:hypothetical protein